MGSLDQISAEDNTISLPYRVIMNMVQDTDSGKTNEEIRSHIQKVRAAGNAVADSINLQSGKKTEAGRLTHKYQSAIAEKLIEYRYQLQQLKTSEETAEMEDSSAPSEEIPYAVPQYYTPPENPDSAFLELSDEQILVGVQEVLIDALGLDDDDEPIPSATLMGNLGAESIDFLDIRFRLEKQFGIKILRNELFPEFGEGIPVTADGNVSEEGLNILREKLPHADLDTFAKNPERALFQDLFTVDMVWNFIVNHRNALKSQQDTE